MTAANARRARAASWRQRLLSPFREFGWWAGAVYLVDQALVRVLPGCRLYCYDFMVQPISDRPLVGSRLVRNIEARELTRDDPEIALMPARDDIKAARFDQDALCLGAFRKGELIGYIWFCFDRYEEDEVRCTYRLSPAAHAVFDFDLYIFPEHRMGLAFVGIWHAANEFLRKRNVRYTFSRLTRFNVASRRAHEHLGWKTVGSAVFVQLGALELMMSSAFPYLNCSLRRARRVEIALSADVLSDAAWDAASTETP